MEHFLPIWSKTHNLDNLEEDSFEEGINPLSIFVNLIIIGIIYFIISIIYPNLSFDNFLITDRNRLSKIAYLLVIIDTIYFFHFYKKNKDKLIKSSFYRNIEKIYKLFILILCIISLFELFIYMVLVFFIFIFIFSANVSIKKKKTIYYIFLLIVFIYQFLLSFSINFSATTPKFEVSKNTNIILKSKIFFYNQKKSKNSVLS